MSDISLKPLYQVRNYTAEVKLSAGWSLAIRINHTLYYQYSSSQNYYYTKEVNAILQSSRTHATIQFIDDNQYFHRFEYLKRFHFRPEFKPKINILTEFYKYHRDLPRWVIKTQILTILSEYYEQTRKLQYYRVQRIIQQENKKNPNIPKKTIIGEKPQDSLSSQENLPKKSLNSLILKDITKHLIETSISGNKELTFQYNQTPSQLLMDSKQSVEFKQMMTLLNASEDENNNIQPAKPQKIISINHSLFKNLQHISKVPQSARYQQLNSKHFEEIIAKTKKPPGSASKERQKAVAPNNEFKLIKNEFFKKLKEKQEKDVKALEQKVLEGLKDLQSAKKKSIEKIKAVRDLKNFSPLIKHDKKSVVVQSHQSINSIMKLCLHNNNRSVSKSNYFSNCDSKNPSPMMKSYVNPRLKKHQVMTLDLKSLLQQHSQKQTEVNSARSEKKSIEDSIKSKEIKTERESQEKKRGKGLSMGYLKEKSYRKGTQSNRKFQSLMQWQIKAMQAVQKEYNLIPK